MQALILCAGYGTRMGDLTKDRPKCMLPVRGQPILEHQIEWLKRYGVRDILVNLHHCPGPVIDYFKDGRRFGVRLVYSIEEEVLGSAGAVRQAEGFLGDDALVVCGDVLCRFSLTWLLDSGWDAVMAVHHSDNPTAGGVVDIDSDGVITRFAEKPQEAVTSIVSSGVLVFHHTEIDWFPETGDVGRHIIPTMLERGLFIKTIFTDRTTFHVSTPEDLEAAQSW